MITVRDICEQLSEHFDKYHAGPDKEDIFMDTGYTWGEAVKQVLRPSVSLLGYIA